MKARQHILTAIMVMALSTLAALLLRAQVYLNPPIITGSNTVRLMVNGPTTNIRYDVYFTNALASNAGTWPLLTIGGTNQVIFDLTVPDTNTGFFLVTSNFVITSNPPPKVATPAFAPPSTTSIASAMVTVTCTNTGAAIYYTTNGNTPTTSDNYIASGGKLLIQCSLTLKARAFQSGFLDSEVASGVYAVNCPPLVFAGYQQITNGTTLTLQGTASDDGQIQALSSTWRQFSGPPGVTFANSNALATTATLPQSGIYVLELEARDGYWTNKSWVTVAKNPSISISLTRPADGSTFSVPTNIVLEALTNGSSVSVTQVQFYADATLLGTATAPPYTFEWRNVPAGTHSVFAVATSSDANNLSLASTAVGITVNFPADLGRFTLAATDLQIPAPGLPITINRSYDSRYGTGWKLGSNARLDYEAIRIEKSASLSGGYLAVNSLSQDRIIPNHNTLVTVSLNETEQYFFKPRIVFQDSGTNSVGQSSVTYLLPVQFVFDSVNGLGQIAPINSPGNVGMFNNNTVNGTWSGAVTTASCDDELCETWTTYEPAWTAFTFTSPDGTQYKFDANGKLSQKIDRNGNSLTYGSTNITHSAGKAIDFVVTSGRITQVRDPVAIASNGVPILKYSYDAGTRLTNVARLVDRAGSGTYENTAYRYEDPTLTNLITRVIDPRALTVVSNLYDSYGRLLRQYDALGNYTAYSYQNGSRRLVVTDRLTRTVRQDFTEAGQVQTLQDAENAVTTYAYDANGRRVAEISPIGATTSYAYNQRDDLLAVTNELSSSSSATYDTYGKPLTVFDPMGNGTTNAYDSKGNLTAVTNALSIVSRYSYDAQGNRKAETNAFGLNAATWTLYDYDNYGNLTNVTDALGNKTAYTCDLNANRVIERRERTLPGGSKEVLWTTNVYDPANRLIATIDTDTYANRTAYNSIGKIAYTTNKLGVVTKCEYDARGLLTNTTFALGTAQQSSEQSAYDAEGRRTNSVDRAGRPTVYTYDGVGRLRLTTYADNSYTENRYDVAGRTYVTVQGQRPGGISPASPIITRFEYDAAGRRTAAINALNQTNRYAYDKNGNQTNIVDALGRTNRYDFDSLNRQVKLIFPDGTSERYAYDGLNRRVALTNQADIVTIFAYDKMGRLTAVTNAYSTGASNWAAYAYDELGNQTNQVDALNRMTRFEYDSMGRRIRTVLPGSQYEAYAYDATGNLIRCTNFNLVVITNQYDPLNRLTNKSSGGGYNVIFTYTATGQRATMTDSSGSYTFAYDSRDRLITNTGPAGTLTNSYDNFGRLGSIRSTRSGGASLTYIYDALNRLTNAADAVAGAASYTYDGVGNLQTVRYPNAVTNTYTYDSLNRLTNLVATNSGGSIASFGYVLGAAGNRTTLTETVNAINRTNKWIYDPLYRLTNETITATSGGTVTYKYDAVGNRTSRTSGVAGLTNQTFSFTTNDWLTADVYDSNGSTRTNGANVFLYDVENRLTNATVGGTTVIYTYNADGIRVSKTVGGTTTLYLLEDRNPSGYAQVLEELTVSGGATNLAKVFTYGLDLIAQRDVSSGLRSFYGYDGNGNTRYLTGTNAAISDTYIYDAFGSLLTSSGSTANDYLYSGEQYDSTLGLYYLRARYLNPGTARFWTRDSFTGLNEEPTSLHKYLYCGSNPINSVDSSGHGTDIGSLLIVASITARISSLLAPAIAVAQRNSQSIVRGLQTVQNIAQAAMARGSEILVWEQRLQNAAGDYIGRFKLDLVIQRVTGQGQTLNTLVEGKGVPWNLTRNAQAFEGYLTQLAKQAAAFARASQSAGVQIQERVIVFSSKIPPGLEEAAGRIQDTIAQYYSRGGVLWGIEAFEQFLEK